ncbi:MAG TPA: metalloregulator ArsR/SmtB family transcription factor [Gammaproteobacteria bacterium]|nr:metalloregulator ArsR/SmtB family transcription factor [Gammaproteobacteria bacterium]
MSRSLPSNVRPLRPDPAVQSDALLSAAELSPEVALLVAQLFQSLADPTRTRIMYALTKGEHSVNELAQIAGISPSATSHQLKSLRDLRIVKFRREGTRVYYAVDDAHVAALFQEALHHVAHVIYGLPDHSDIP